MAQRLQNLNVIAPGFLGINSEDSPLSVEPGFASIADNCVIDNFGRIASRKGYELLTTDATELNGEAITNIHQFLDSSGNEVIFSTGNNKILSGTATLVDETPDGYTISDNEWTIINFNDQAYFFQQGKEPLVYDPAQETETDASAFLGTNLFVNDDSQWTLDTGVTVSDGVLTFTGAESNSLGTNFDFGLSAGLEDGERYAVEFEIVTYVSGTCSFRLGSSGNDTVRVSGAGTYLLNFYGTTAGTEGSFPWLQAFGHSTFVGAIRVIALRKIQAPSDSFDVGSNLLTNGDFASDISGWEGLSGDGGTVSWNSGAIRVDSTGVARQRAQQIAAIPVTAGQMYRFQCNKSIISGGSLSNTQVKVGTTAYGNDLLFFNDTNEAQDFFFIAPTGFTEVYVSLQVEGGDRIAEFDNVSILLSQQVGEAMRPITEHTSWDPPSGRSLPDGKTALAAYGRLWVAGFADDPHTIYWSDTLIGTAFTGGASGSIDISRAWPNGYDEIQALVAHNNLLIVFGRNSIVMYEGPDDPSTMSLVDTIRSVGAYSDKAVQYIGSDILFFSNDGLRSFGRAVQEKSLPLTNLSQNIKKELSIELQLETEPVRTMYCPAENFILLILEGRQKVYCFDIRMQTESGGYRVTKWPEAPFTCFQNLANDTVYVGTTGGIGQYTGFSDGGSSYLMRYFSTALTFGDSSVLKIVKKLRPSVLGTVGTDFTVKWAYDLRQDFKSKTVTIIDTTGFASQYGTAEFNTNEFTDGIIADDMNVNLSGFGRSLTVGLECTIDDQSLSLQEYNVQALIGKIG